MPMWENCIESKRKINMWKAHAFILSVNEKEYYISARLSCYITDLENT